MTVSSEHTIFLDKDDEQAKLLEACSSADMAACISTDKTQGALNLTNVHVRKSLFKILLHVRSELCLQDNQMLPSF